MCEQALDAPDLSGAPRPERLAAFRAVGEHRGTKTRASVDGVAAPPAATLAWLARAARYGRRVELLPVECEARMPETRMQPGDPARTPGALA